MAIGDFSTIQNALTAGVKAADAISYNPIIDSAVLNMDDNISDWSEQNEQDTWGLYANEGFIMGPHQWGLRLNRVVT